MAAASRTTTEYSRMRAAAARERTKRESGQRSYIEGNTARKLAPRAEALPREDYERTERVRTLPRNKAAVMPMQEASAAKAERRDALKTICVIIAVFAMLALVVGRYSIINANYLENYKLQTNIDSMQEQINTLQLNIAVEGNLDEITRIAKDELNMGFPDGNQVQYITVNTLAPKAAEMPAQESAVQRFINSAIETVAGWFK